MKPLSVLSTPSSFHQIRDQEKEEEEEYRGEDLAFLQAITAVEMMVGMKEIWEDLSDKFKLYLTEHRGR